jgi:hypothetical protein
LYGENAADIQGSWEIEHAFSEIFSQCGAGFITERANVEIVGGEVRGL